MDDCDEDDDDYDMEDVDSYSPPKKFKDAPHQDAILGKRVQRALSGAPDGDMGDEMTS
jgi:hypothetical protein